MARAENPQKNPEHAFRQVADEGGLVVVPDQSSVEVLNPVGSKVYSMLDGTHTVDEIVAAVVEEFDVTAEQARQDVERFLDQLESKKMLAGANAEGGAGTG